MNALGDPFKQLMERKLWPVALLLIAALVAVPFLLKKDPETTVLPLSTAAVGAGQPTSTADSIVSLSDAETRDGNRAVLGDRKDPFRPARLERVPKADDLLGSDAGGATQVDAGATGGTDASAGAGTGTGTQPQDVDPTVPTPVDPPKTFDLYSLKVRFGSTEGDALTTRNVKRLTGIPGGVNPAALYLGLSEDRKSAVFIIDAGVTVLGDGTCDPDPENCQTLVLKPGETVFLTRGDKQWELDLVKIYSKKTTSEDEAVKAKESIAVGGREALRQQLGRIGRYRYNADRGVLEKVGAKEQAARELKAKVAKTALTGIVSG